MNDLSKQEYISEINRLNKIIDVLATRAEQGINSESSDFSLFQTTIALEEKVRKRTEELRDTQKKLVESEKMASLGRLVSGVAHELNTPIGICITSSSLITEITEEVHTALSDNEITESQLIEYFSSVNETVDLIANNLSRSSTLISYFKQVSVSNSSEEIAKFNLKEILDDVNSIYINNFLSRNIIFSVECNDNIELTSYPDALAKILSNLIAKSLDYAFDEESSGKIIIEVTQDDESIKLLYRDSGKGMSADVSSNIFEPFFTTNRSNGNTGLGMFILYNLITQQLNGDIQCTSELGKGTTFVLSLPNLNK